MQEGTKSLRSWDEIRGLYDASYAADEPDGRSGPVWVFRGVESAEYGLEPVLEREVMRLEGDLSRMPLHETRLLREFKRQYHQYSAALPTWKDDYRWLALLRHHFGPTRLLDFTYSFWVALYFAVERARPGNHS